MVLVAMWPHRATTLEGTQYYPNAPLTQKSHLKDLIPKTQPPQDRKNTEPPTCGEHFL